jgi:D-amino-acid oxidase
VTGTRPDVAVVGAGVIGLTTAVCLAERGRSVLVVSRDQPLASVSAVASAMVGPWFGPDGDPLIARARAEAAELTALAGMAGTGVWAELPLVDMPVYLDYLTRRLAAAGGRIEAAGLGTLAEAALDHAVVPAVGDGRGHGVGEDLLLAALEAVEDGPRHRLGGGLEVLLTIAPQDRVRAGRNARVTP